MKEIARVPEHRFELTGGALCLDFTNTLGDRPLCREEHLNGYGDLLSWAGQAGAVTRGECRDLAALAGRHPGRARAALGKAIELREDLYRVFSAVARGGDPSSGDLEALNARLAETLPRLLLERAPGRFTWVFRPEREALDRMLWPVVRSAGDLLTSDEARVVRECASERCSWLFVDRSRTHRRRWCDMRSCGNRAKARRHYLRTKESESGS